MAIVVETGQLVEGANSYISISDAQDFLVSRGLIASPTDLTEGHVLRGADYLNTLSERYKGVKRTNITNPHRSAMQWPRLFVFIDSIPVGSEEIPALLIEAQIEVAYEISMGRDPLSTKSTRVVKKEKVDVIEVEYQIEPGGSPYADFDYRRVHALLAPLLTDDLFRVSR